MMASEVTDLKTLVGRKVRTVRAFVGIAQGTVGVVASYYSLGEGHQGIKVKWTTTEGDEVEDGFGRDADFDETKYLKLEP